MGFEQRQRKLRLTEGLYNGLTLQVYTDGTANLPHLKRGQNLSYTFSYRSQLSILDRARSCTFRKYSV